MPMKLIIVRGLPGSGKTTYAKSLGIAHVETDMFFMKDGFYQFDPALLPENHRKCYEQVRAHLLAECDCVVSNTFTELWEMQEYLDLGEELGAEVEVVRMTGAFGSVHSIPEHAIELMRQRFEVYPGETLMAGKG